MKQFRPNYNQIYWDFNKLATTKVWDSAKTVSNMLPEPAIAKAGL